MRQAITRVEDDMPVRGLALDGTIAATSAAVFAVDGDGRVALWSPAAEKLVGYAAREALGRPSCEVFPPTETGGRTLCYAGCHPALISLDAETARVDLHTRTDGGRPIRLGVTALVLARPGDRGLAVIHRLHEATAPAPRWAHPGAADGLPLTRRELDVLRLMGAGLNTRRIAGTLGVRDATVRNHVQNILGKLDVHSRLAAVAVAHRAGLI